MGACKVESTKDARLTELINRLGQYEGLRTYLNERINGVSEEDSVDELISTGDNSFETLASYLKGQLRIKYGRLSKLTAAIKVTKDLTKLKPLEASRAKVLNEIETLKSRLKSYAEKADAELIKSIAFEQLSWVSTVLSKETISESELNEANFVIDLWSNVRDIMYSQEEELPEDIKSVFNEIYNKVMSDDLYANWFKVSSSYLATQSGYASASQLITEFSNVKDRGFAGTYGLDMSRTGIRLINEADKLIRNNMSRADYEAKDWIKKIDSIFSNLREKNKSPDLFWQKNNKGELTGNLTNRYSQEFYSERTKVFRKFKAAIESAAGNPIAIRRAFEERNKWLKENTETVDIRFFINPNYSTTTGITKEDYVRYLEEQYGKRRAEEMINQALEQYEKYKEAYEAIRLENRDAVITGRLSEEEANKNLEEWVSLNSPVIWLNQSDPYIKGEHRVYTQHKNSFVVTKAKKKYSNGKETPWYDKNYEYIENDPDLLEAYNFIREFINTMMAYIPKYLTRDQDIHAGFLPRLKKELILSMAGKDLKGIVKVLTDDMVNNLTSVEGLDQRFVEINPVTKQPYKTIRMAGLSNIPIEERSTDLQKILTSFANIAVAYKWKSKSEDAMLLINRFVDNVSKSELRKQNTSDELTNIKRILEYTEDVLLYDKRKEDEGVTKVKLYKGDTYLVKEGDNRELIDGRYKQLIEEGNSHELAIELLKKEYPSEVTIISKRRKVKILEGERDIIEERFYKDEITEEDRDALLAPLEEEAKSLGRNLVMSKVGDSLIRCNQALALGFNPFSAVNNYMFGITSNIIWAAGKTDFNPSQMWQAFGMMWKSALTLKNKKFDKVANLIVKFNILSETVEFNGETTNETLKKIKDAPYVLLRKGDYFIKGQTFIALMLNTKIKDINGNERSLYEAYDNEGNWNVEEFGEDRKWNGNPMIEGELEDFLNFRNKATQLIKKLHGNFDPNSPVLYKKHIVGRMLGQFRFSWMMEGFAQRFESRKYDTYLGRDIEGRWYTMYSTLGWKKSLNILAKLALHQKSAFNGVKPQDKLVVEENMRRNLMEIYLYAIMFTVFLMLKHAISDDDDEKRGIKIALNLLDRVMSDTTFYLSPSTFTKLINEPFPILKLYQRGEKAFSSATQLIMNGDLTDEEIEQKWINITNAVPYLNQPNRFNYMSEKVLNP